MMERCILCGRYWKKLVGRCRILGTTVSHTYVRMCVTLGVNTPLSIFTLQINILECVYIFKFKNSTYSACKVVRIV